MDSLDGYKSNTYSQFGEDGIIEEILNRILSGGNALDHWCCEFGAWDGLMFSNTASLIMDRGFRAVLIEGDQKRVRDLKRNYPDPEILKIHSLITPSGDSSLDSVLSQTPIPKDFDFLSIDIDGNDYHVLASLKTYKPKVICIEFNPTIPNSVIFIQKNDITVKHGSSALAISRLGEALGYSPVAATHCNLFFVRNEYIGAVLSTPVDLKELNPKGNEGQYIFSGYDGTLLSNKQSFQLNWHGLVIPVAKLQILPIFLRRYSGDYSLLDRFLFRVFRVTSFPTRQFWPFNIILSIARRIRRNK